MMDDRIQMAARNNALWCDTICRAHGSPGMFLESIWLNKKKTPRFYPNAVTITGEQHAADQRARIEKLTLAGIPGDWAVKDSFAILDLSRAGFLPLFEASWIWRSPDLPIPAARQHVLWRQVRDSAILASWEKAWNGGAESSPNELIFLPPLLDDPEIAFFAGWQDEKIVAGGIAYCTGQVIGLSNVFTTSADPLSDWAGCLSAVMETFPGLPVVDYESGEDLSTALAAGFELLGPLRVWVHPEKPKT